MSIHEIEVAAIMLLPVLSCYPTVTELTSPGHRALADLTDPQHGPVQGELQKYHAKISLAKGFQSNSDFLSHPLFDY